jgi:hypothetical protein
MENNLIALLEEPFEETGHAMILPGTIALSVVPFVEERYRTIRPCSNDPANPDFNKLAMKPTSYSDLCDSERPPNHNLGLRSDEDLLVYRVKKRPVVVLSPQLKKAKGMPSHIEGCVLCAPIFTLADSDGMIKKEYTNEAAMKIFGLQCTQLFPLPGRGVLRSEVSIIRLDRIHAAHANRLISIKYRLTKRWRRYMSEWLRLYLKNDETAEPSNKIVGDLFAAREAYGEAMAKVK